MDDSLVFTGLMSIPSGIVLASVGTIGISGALTFTVGTALGAFSGRQLGREFTFRLLPERFHQITVLALGFFSTISGGWLLANSCGFAISFEASLLVLTGGIMLLGVCCLIAICIEDTVAYLFSKKR